MRFFGLSLMGRVFSVQVCGQQTGHPETSTGALWPTVFSLCPFVFISFVIHGAIFVSFVNLWPRKKRPQKHSAKLKSFNVDETDTHRIESTEGSGGE